MLFDLPRLTEFNKALVYGLKAESSPERQNGSCSLKDTLFPEMAQHEDLFMGYMYAQQHILPSIRRVGIENITEDLLINWIKNLHKFMGKSLLKTHGEGLSGQYTTEEVFRWHPSTKVQHHILNYMNKTLSIEELGIVVEQELGVKKEDIMSFAGVLDRVKQLPNSILWPWQLTNLVPNQDNSLFIWMKKLFAAYHQNRLNPKEKFVMDKIVTVCVPPDQIESLMQDYAKQTLRLWKVCNPNNLDGLAQLLSETFYGLTKIHPFVNANGRTATCLVNIILRSFDLPSILIREPEENHARHSNYSRAMDCITKSRKPFADHIKARILAAKKHPFSDPDLEKLITLRIEWMDLLKTMLNKFPTFNMDKEMYSLQQVILSEKTYSKDDLLKTKVQIEIVSAIKEGFQKQMALLEAPLPLVSANQVSFFNQQSFNKAMKVAAIGLTLAAGMYLFGY